MLRHVRSQLLLACLLLLLPIAAEGVGTTIYATNSRTTQFVAANTVPDVCALWGWQNMSSNQTLIAGYWAYGGGDGTEYGIRRFIMSFNLAGLTGILDSARVVLPVLEMATACTGDPNIGFYVGDCSIAGDCTSSTPGFNPDTSSCPALVRQWVNSAFTGNSVSWKIPADSLTIGTGHTYDIRVATTSNEVPAICDCGPVAEDEWDTNNILLGGPLNTTPSNRPYMIVFTHPPPPAETPALVATSKCSKDGDTWWTSTASCPVTASCTVEDTRTTAIVEVAKSGSVGWLWKAFFSFDTSPMASVDSATLVLYVADIYNATDSIALKFPTTDISDPLVCADTSLFATSVAADTLIGHSRFLLALNDSIRITVRGDKVDPDGYTEVVMKHNKEASACTGGTLYMLALGTCEAPGDPVLYVYGTLDSTKKRRGPFVLSDESDLNPSGKKVVRRQIR